MSYFERGDCLTVGGDRIVIDEFLSSGMQADVYRVIDVDRGKHGKHMVIKHLYGDYCNNKKLFFNKVKNSQYTSSSSCASDLAAGGKCFR